MGVQVLGRRLAQIGGNEVLALPFFDAITSAVRADALAAAMDAAAGEEAESGSSDSGGSACSAASGAGEGSSSSSALEAALLAQRPVLRQTDAEAYAQAASAAARSIAQQLQQQAGGGGDGVAAPGADAAGRAGGLGTGAPLVLNTAAERGVQTQDPSEVLEAGERRGGAVAGGCRLTAGRAPGRRRILGRFLCYTCVSPVAGCLVGAPRQHSAPSCPHADELGSEPDSLALALRLEAAVWQEIDAVQALAGKLRGRASPLPEGVQCLRPPAAAGADAAAQAGARPAAAQAAELAAEEQKAHAPKHPVAPPDYPALRRAQRLSFACAALLADLSATEGRQAWVEAGSTCGRLRLALAALRKHRQVLAAVVAVEGL